MPAHFSQGVQDMARPGSHERCRSACEGAHGTPLFLPRCLPVLAPGSEEIVTYHLQQSARLRMTS